MLQTLIKDKVKEILCLNCIIHSVYLKKLSTVRVMESGINSEELIMNWDIKAGTET